MAIESLSSRPTGAGTPIVPAQPRPPAREGPAPAAESQPAPAVDRAQLQHAIETVNRQLAAAAQNLRFSVDDDTGKTVVRVVDTATGEVIRQVPSDELLAISRSIDRLQGLLFRQEA
jgi:flagellar protein FlaG